MLMKFHDPIEIIMRFQDQLDYRDCAKAILKRNLHQKVISLVIEKFEKQEHKNQMVSAILVQSIDFKIYSLAIKILSEY